MRDFVEIVRQDTEVIRSLLETGEPPERIRAAWALALRLGGTVRPELIQGSLAEPHPGVRRHLVVVLAGYQERVVLATLARQDFDADVRAVACQYLGTLGGPEDAESWRVLHERLESDASAEVRRTAIAYLPPHIPAFLRGAVAARTGDESLDVRRAAVDKLMEWAGLLRHGPSEEEFEARLNLEPDFDPVEVLKFVLTLYRMHWKEAELPWECLRPFTQSGEPDPYWDTQLLELLEPLSQFYRAMWSLELLEPRSEPEADAWVLEVALRFWRKPSQGDETKINWVALAAEEALKCLKARFEAGYLKVLDARGKALARELREALDLARRQALEDHRSRCEQPEHGECFGKEWSLDGMMAVLLELSGPEEQRTDG
ncbi:HEAT repeat protein [Archangium gephyra]|uniref:HEAT repeat protein n=1 Tax=Archangium gephyra TaxID=48 RepID=A0AAC8TGX8_9BACT|nr:HEAT repeat domain-containing protein [Archangium gephyra]AKJ03991.1 Hypothetical protein AA314_05617 [Archangium gephyra]REG37919.1 HEAT repeat protein [Archangium gephyra]